jgi:hypothetical protein
MRLVTASPTGSADSVEVSNPTLAGLKRSARYREVVGSG